MVIHVRLYLTYCAGASDEEDEVAWYVVAEYATDQRRALETIDIVEAIWNKEAEFMTFLCVNQKRAWSPHTVGKSATSIYGNWQQSPKFRAHSCVRMSTCAIVELELELPIPSASCYSNSRALVTRIAFVCVACLPPDAHRDRDRVLIFLSRISTGMLYVRRGRHLIEYHRGRAYLPALASVSCYLLSCSVFSSG